MSFTTHLMLRKHSCIHLSLGPPDNPRRWSFVQYHVFKSPLRSCQAPGWAFNCDKAEMSLALMKLTDKSPRFSPHTHLVPFMMPFSHCSGAYLHLP